MSSTAAYKIFNVYFECLVANMHLHTDEELGVYGSLTNDPATDMAMAYEKSVVLLNIATIAEFHDDGVSVTLTDPAKANDLYQIITQHLRDWQEFERRSVGPVNIPVDDLAMLDALAGDVLNTARAYIRGPIERPTFFKERVSRSRIKRREVEKPQPELQYPTEVGGGTPIADAIARANFKRKG